MRIRHAEIVESVMPKEDPNWRFALGGTAASEGFVLRLTADDGTEGYGFCASAFHYLTLLGQEEVREQNLCRQRLRLGAQWHDRGGHRIQKALSGKRRSRLH